MAIKVKYISDADGNAIEVVVPIALWRAMASSPEVANLLGQGELANSSPGEPDGKERSPTTYIGAEDVTGLPVFITPPGSPTLTSEHVNACLKNSEKVEEHQRDPGERTPRLTLEEAGIEICEETGLPVFRMPVGAPQISTEFIRSLEDEW